MSLKSILKIDRSICLSLLSLAVVTAVSQAEKAIAVDLKFDASIPAADPNNDPLGLGAGVGSNVIDYLGVVPGVVDARITATAFGDGYSFTNHTPNYTAAGSSNGDTAFLYRADREGFGGLTYKIDLFQSGTNFTTAYVAPNLRFLVYDVDGDPNQSEAVRIAKNSSFVGYQLGNTPQALTVDNTTDPNSYLFSGIGSNVDENDATGAAIFYFENTNSVTFQFESNTLSSSSFPNSVFSAFDGDLSLLQNLKPGGGFNPVTSTAVPEPFTVIGTIIGGAAALRLRKKLKAAKTA